MRRPPSSGPRWPTRVGLQSHFRKHGHKFPFLDVHSYETSSLSTILTGRRFTYQDRRTGASRVGYYDAVTGRFTALSHNEAAVLTQLLGWRRVRLPRRAPSPQVWLNSLSAGASDLSIRTISDSWPVLSMTKPCKTAAFSNPNFSNR